MALLTYAFHNHALQAQYTMRVVGLRDQYGLEMCKTHDQEDPLVEFYDRRWQADTDPEGFPLGQFISRYNLSTLLNQDAEGKNAFQKGILLDGSEAWSVDSESLEDCMFALRMAGIVPSDPEDVSVTPTL